MPKKIIISPTGNNTNAKKKIPVIPEQILNISNPFFISTPCHLNLN